MAFIRVSSRIINLDQIAHIEVMETNNRVEVAPIKLRFSLLA